MFTLQPCADKGGLSAKLAQPRTLNLHAISVHFHTIISTPHVIVIKTDAGEAIVHSYGEIIFKEAKDENAIKRIAETIFECA